MAAPGLPLTGLDAPASVDNNLDDHPLILHADEPLVIATPFLQWQACPPAAPGGPPRMSVPHSRAAKAFLRRSSLDMSPVNAQGFAAINCFEFFLNAAAWNRILDALLESNLLANAPFAAWATFLTHLEQLPLSQPNQFLLAMADIDQGDSFDTPAVQAQAAVPGVPRGRNQAAVAAIPAVPAQPAVPGPADIAFLSLVTIPNMLKTATSSPLGVWCDFVGSLSAGRTRASRLTPLANVRTAGAMLHSAVSARLIGAAAGLASDAVVAVNLPDILQEIQLPRCLLPFELGEADLRAELRDCVRAARSDADRQAVEVSRIHYTSLRYATSCPTDIYPHNLELLK